MQNNNEINHAIYLRTLDDEKKKGKRGAEGNGKIIITISGSMKSTNNEIWTLVSFKTEQETKGEDTIKKIKRNTLKWSVGLLRAEEGSAVCSKSGSICI